MTAPKPWRRRVSRFGGVPLDFVTDAPQLAAGSFTQGKLTKILVSQELEIKKGPQKAPFDFWPPGQDPASRGTT